MAAGGFPPGGLHRRIHLCKFLKRIQILFGRFVKRTITIIRQAAGFILVNRRPPYAANAESNGYRQWERPHLAKVPLCGGGKPAADSFKQQLTQKVQPDLQLVPGANICALVRFGLEEKPKRNARNADAQGLCIIVRDLRLTQARVHGQYAFVGFVPEGKLPFLM